MVTRTNTLEAPLGKGSVVQQVDELIRFAVNKGASDIHVEPYEKIVRVRIRLDGLLHILGEISLTQRDAFVSRLKIISSLDIAEKRRPQDGRIKFSHDGRSIDIRVSTLPTQYGEKVVLRILDKGHLDLDLEKLGFGEQSLVAVRQAIHLPYGMVLVTGPTGSGKTTTLYAALNELNRPDINLSTIEDPVEYNLEGINQTRVRTDIGLTFASALRAFLRQDPDIIMVGEVRDSETAEIAVRAALTGHLVLSTIHTNDAPSTIGRFVDMGVEPFLVASTLRIVIAQRLVRRVCRRCRYSVLPETAIATSLEIEEDALIQRGRGCPACNGTGYQGRTALFEVMPVTEEISELIARNKPTTEIRRAALTEGMISLRKSGKDKILAGETTPEEVLRETTI